MIKKWFCFFEYFWSLNFFLNHVFFLLVQGSWLGISNSFTWLGTTRLERRMLKPFVQNYSFSNVYTILKYILKLEAFFSFSTYFLSLLHSVFFLIRNHILKSYLFVLYVNSHSSQCVSHLVQHIYLKLYLSVDNLIYKNCLSIRDLFITLKWKIIH